MNEEKTQIADGVASELNAELGIFDYIAMHKEHHRQCPKCSSEDVKFAKHFIDNKEMVSAHCYECEHEEVATLDKAEALIDNWFNV